MEGCLTGEGPGQAGAGVGGGGQRQDSCEEAAGMRGEGEAKAEAASMEDRSSSQWAPHWGWPQLSFCPPLLHQDMCPAWPEFLTSQERREIGNYG